MRRLILWFRLRAKQIHVDGVEKAIEYIPHPAVQYAYITKRLALKRELHRLLGLYKATDWSRDPWRKA